MGQLFLDDFLLVLVKRSRYSGDGKRQVVLVDCHLEIPAPKGECMEPFQYYIDVDQSAGKNSRFWAACGLDSLYPLLFTEGGETLLQRMQEKGTCFWMRNHHTLSSLEKDGFSHAGGDVYSEDEEGNPVYHFSCFHAGSHSSVIVSVPKYFSSFPKKCQFLFSAHKKEDLLPLFCRRKSSLFLFSFSLRYLPQS